MSIPSEKVGDKGQRYEISYILPDGTMTMFGWAEDPDAFRLAGEKNPKLAGAKRRVFDRQTQTFLPTSHEDRAKEIYTLAWKRAAGIVAMYQVRNYPKERPQAVPAYKNEGEYEFFKDVNGDADVLELTFPEWEIYLVALEKILLDQHGIPAKRVFLSQHEFRDFVTEAESAQ